MSTDTSAQRAAFEAWFAESRKSKGPSRRPTFERFEDGTYADDSTQRHWWTWQHAASPQPTAAQPLTDEQIDAVALHAVYDDDDTCAYRDAWCREVGRPFARAIERAHGIGASAAPAQAAPNYAGPKDCPDEAWELALKVRADLDRISCPGVYMDKAVDAICKRWSAAPVAELVEALQAARDLLADMPIPDGYYSCSNEVISKLDAALSRAPGASNVRAKRETRDE